MKGKVLFFNTQKGFGKIKTEENQSREAFIHFTQILDNAKLLLEDEEVEFDLENSSKGLSAKNLRRNIEREIGVIDQFENGFGFIHSSSSEDEKYFIHHSDVIGTGFKKIEAGFEVEFTPSVSSKGLQAKDVILRDERTALEKFAIFPDWNNAIRELAINNAQPEDGNWDYLKNKTGSYPVLESYITYTFSRLHKEGKIKYATKNEKGKDLKFACFNTGLATIKQEDIFAYFEHRDNTSNRKDSGYLKQPIWVFKCFDRESNRIMNSFVEKPELANYFQNAEELIYESGRRLIPDFEHILDDRENRFPEDFKVLSKAQQVERIKSAIDSALTRIRRNYKTAIPQFYSNSIQLLLPLCITTAEQADVALVVAREGEVYRANTILPLDWAYNNARLLAKPDREWLNP